MTVSSSLRAIIRSPLPISRRAFAVVLRAKQDVLPARAGVGFLVSLPGRRVAIVCAVVTVRRSTITIARRSRSCIAG